MEVALEFVKQKKWWMIVGLVFLLLLIAGLFLPSQVFKWKIGKMELNNVERVEYVEYTGTVFSSPIKVKRALSVKNNKTVFDGLIQEIQQMDRKKNSSQQHNKVLFFYHSNGEIFNAYVEGNLLGFNYGHHWLKVEKLGHIIEDMYIVEPLRIKNNPIAIEN